MPLQSVTPPALSAGLVERMGAVEDPRRRRGLRHEVGCVLAVALCAMLCGAVSLRAIGQWAAHAPQHALTRLDCRVVQAELGVRAAPSTSTIRRVLIACVPQAVACLGRPRHLAVLAVDGKTARGSGRGDEAAAHLLAALAPDRRVAAQRQVPAKTSEIAAVEELLCPLDITGTVITADALHTQAATARALTGRGADYVLTVKRNQPTLFGQVTALPWAQVPLGGKTTSRGHGRAETRTVKALTVGGLGLPGAVQAVRIRRHVTDLRTGRTTWTCAYVVTSLPAERAGAARIGDLVRSHWQIESLHHIRDTTFGEDACLVRRGHGPVNLASLRNLAIALLSTTGHTTIPDAIRWISYDAFTRPLDLIHLN